MRWMRAEFCAVAKALMNSAREIITSLCDSRSRSFSAAAAASLSAGSAGGPANRRAHPQRAARREKRVCRSARSAVVSEHERARLRRPSLP